MIKKVSIKKQNQKSTLSLKITKCLTTLLIIFHFYVLKYFGIWVEFFYLLHNKIRSKNEQHLMEKELNLKKQS